MFDLSLLHYCLILGLKTLKTSDNNFYNILMCYLQVKRCAITTHKQMTSTLGSSEIRKYQESP